ncbi:uncharacterized protein isoform X2 [Rhodnius prolixus]|uniref:uncharacterized protein isoform X2 n=1 Tax=Rhodnius prolixus TaxID=13249 RepID=UPI003D1896ED
MLPTLDDNIINTIENDKIKAVTVFPDMQVNPVSNSTSFTPTSFKPSSVVTVTLFIIIGLLAFAFSILHKNKKNNKMMQCELDVKSFYVNYGSTNILLPHFMTHLSDIKEYSINDLKLKKCKKAGKKHQRLCLPNDLGTIYGFRAKQITMVSDLWKANSKKSNNYFLINIIPEEDELLERNS